MALHGLADVPEVSIEWIQWCDVHVRLFPPAISPLFQPLPHNSVPGMDELVPVITLSWFKLQSPIVRTPWLTE
jgi:hypothetical protein